ncbi:MAG TPA: hypothetical protein V6C65_28935 [Allocoleopsis sp.]
MTHGFNPRVIVQVEKGSTPNLPHQPNPLQPTALTDYQHQAAASIAMTIQTMSDRGWLEYKRDQ